MRLTRPFLRAAALLERLLRRQRGPLTDTLRLEPGRSGLGARVKGREPDRLVSQICGFCATGCGLDVHLRQGKVTGITPSPSYPVNRGTACPKGWEAIAPLGAPDRGVAPLLAGKPVSWAEAEAVFARNMASIRERHGGEALAVLSTGQIPVEEMFALGLLARLGLGIAHYDSNTRQCMATSHVAYKQSFGFDAPPYSYEDFEESEVIVLVGANLCIAHPILWERVARNPHRPEIVVVDPRHTETARMATRHIALTPKSDLDLFYGLAHLVLEQGGLDRAFIAAHTTGFEAFAAHLSAFTPERTAAATGIPEAALRDLARLLGSGKRVSYWWTMGVNQSHQGVLTAQALVNLALMTGNIGKPGTGANSITGQMNAMGSRLFSLTTGLPAGRDFAREDHRRETAELLGMDPARFPRSPGLAYDQIIEGIDAGRIKALWVVATNPAHSWIDQERLLLAFSRLEFLVVQDMYPTTKTARLAHLYLPAAGWGEKEGFIINSERRLGPLKPVRPPPGEARTDFAIFRALAQASGCEEVLASCETPRAAFETLKRLSRGRPCDISGITDYEMLTREGGVQWPWAPAENIAAPAENAGSSGRETASAVPPENAAAGVRPPQNRRLFEDGIFFHPDGRARFLFGSVVPPPEKPDAAFPFWLLTGRGSSVQWHTGTRTDKSPLLRKMAPREAYVELHPRDAQRLGIRMGGWVKLESRRGGIRARARLTANCPEGEVFCPMHYAEVNRLTYPAFDPSSRQPSYKACAVRLSPGEA